MKKLLFLLVIASSCAPVYVPNIRNTPMFTKGGEAQASFQVGNGLDVQAAYSLTNNIGVIGGYSYINNENSEEDYHRHKFFEGGLGYFNNTERLRFEFFAGYGKGEGSSYEEFEFFGTQKVQATGKYERFFIQPGLGFAKESFQGSFVPRFSYVNFTEFSDGTTTLVDNRDGVFFFEPAFVGRYNTMNNRIFFTFQGGFSAAITEDDYFNHRNFQFSTGIGIRLGGIPNVAVK